MLYDNESTYDFTGIDSLDELSGVFAINSASQGMACSQHLLNGSSESLAHALLFHDLSDLLYLFECKVTLMLNILHLLSISGGFTKFLDQQRRSGGEDRDFSISVLYSQLDHTSDSFNLGRFLDDVISYFLGVKTHRT